MVMWSDCTHIYGLMVNTVLSSGPDGHLRTGSSLDKRPVMASPASKFSRRRSDRSRYQLLNLALSHDISNFPYVVPSRTGDVGAPGGQQRPKDPGLLSSQRHHRLVESAPGFQGQNPATGSISAASELPHHSAGPVNQQRAEVDIPALRDTTQSTSAATGMLPGNQPQPGCKLLAVLEGAGIPDGGLLIDEQSAKCCVTPLRKTCVILLPSSRS